MRSKKERRKLNWAQVECDELRVRIWMPSSALAIIMSSPIFDAPWKTRARVLIAEDSNSSNSIVR